MGTVRDLIRRSMMLIGAVATGETPTADEQADALLTLNDMLDGWSNESLVIYTRVREEFLLTAGQQAYTMGPAGNFATTRPQRIVRALYKQTGVTPAYEIPIEILNLDRWADITVKASPSSIPTMLYAEGTYPLETINLWPMPNTASTLVLYSWKPLTAFADVNTTVSLPPGYQKALRYNLAVELAPEYGKQTAPEVLAFAVDAKEAIKRMNIKPLYMDCDEAVLRSSNTFNWLTGE